MKIAPVQPLLIGDTRRQSREDRLLSVRNPSTAEVLTRVSSASDSDIDDAVASARNAFDGAWGEAAPVDRARVLMRIANGLLENLEEFATIETLDTGKPLHQSRYDITVAARYFEFYAGTADKIGGETIPLAREFIDFTLREPIGVSAQIVPWNYPLQLASRGIAPALAAGCTVVAKPSTLAPLSTLRLGELALTSGLPPGALNVVTGNGSEAGAALARHPGINQLTFTGSIEAGVAVARSAAENVVPVTMELGGKSPNVVFADADLSVAATAVRQAIFHNSGQTCSAGSRLLVEDSIHDELLERLVHDVRAMRLGAGMDDPDMGPVISAEQVARVEHYVSGAIAEGSRTAVGGGRPKQAGLTGYFFEPTVMSEVRPAMTIAREEVFGPVLSVIRFKTLGEAADLANATEFGLIAGVWTRDIDKALYMAKRIRAGQVFINTYSGGSGVELPFGGNKKSGYGREKGLEGLRAYTQVKNVCIKVAPR